MANTSTKELVQVADIRDKIVLLKNGSLRAVIGVSAINFELRSEEEQIGILQNFQNFLNSLEFPLQIVINSRQLNMDEYLKLVDETADALDNELLKIQAVEYSKFVKELLQLSNIMSKKFYVILPFYIYETPTKAGLLDVFTSIFSPSKVAQQLDAEKIDKYQQQLMQRAELVLDGMLGLGLKASLMEEAELKNLFYTLYNPGEQHLVEKTEETNA